MDDFIPSGWQDDVADVTSTNPFIYRSLRRYPRGGERWGKFQQPQLISRYAYDGAGVENIFTIYSSGTLPTDRRPLNSWLYDQPGTNGGQVWNDGAPDTTPDNPFLLRSERSVDGSPAVGDAVSDSWSVPVVGESLWFGW